jgi:hypothetical protein
VSVLPRGCVSMATKGFSNGLSFPRVALPARQLLTTPHEDARMTLLFALIPMLLALAIFIGTFRLQTPRSNEPIPRPVVTQRVSVQRTPLPAAVRRDGGRPELRA